MMKSHLELDSIDIAAGTIDDDSVEGDLVPVSAHIFVSQKASWFAIGQDGLKRWDRFTGGYQLKLDEWERKRKEGGKEGDRGKEQA